MFGLLKAVNKAYPITAIATKLLAVMLTTLATQIGHVAGSSMPKMFDGAPKIIQM